MLPECLWRPNSGCEHSEVVGGVFQQWWVAVTVVVISVGADFYEYGIQSPVHCWGRCIASGGDYVKKYCFAMGNLLYQTVLLCSLDLL